MLTSFTIDCFESAWDYYHFTKQNRRDDPKAWEEMRPDIMSFMDEWGRNEANWTIEVKNKFIASMQKHYNSWFTPIALEV